MTYILIFDTQDSQTGRKVARRLRRTARRLQRNIWELKSLWELEAVTKLVRKGGGWTKAFSKKDEIILDKIQLLQALKTFSKGGEE